jgi:hypothetical protein
MSSDQIKKREYMKNFFMPKSGVLSPLYAGLGAETQRAVRENSAGMDSSPVRSSSRRR